MRFNSKRLGLAVATVVLPAMLTLAIPVVLVFLGLRAIYRRARANRKTEEPQVVVEEKKKK